MGLDQWFYKSKESCVYKAEEFQEFLDKDNTKESCVYKTEEFLDEDNANEKQLHLPEDAEQFFHFRKYHELNEWFCDECVPDDIIDFNCVPIELTKEMAVILFNSVVKGDVVSKWHDHNEEILAS